MAPVTFQDLLLAPGKAGKSPARWNNTDLDALKSLTGADFEAVAAALMTSPNSGAARS